MELSPNPAATAPPLTPGQVISLTISDVAFGGEGVGRWNDFVVFVPFVLPDEEVEVTIADVKKRFARATLRSVRKPAADRVSPPCPYFGQCGGCQYQHIAYEAQLRIKGKQLADLLARLGGIDPAAIEPVVPCPQTYGYRNRIMVRSQWDKFKGGLNIGFIRADSRLVIDVEECRIASPALNAMLREVRQNPPPKGGIKALLREPIPGWEVPRDSFFQNNLALLPSLVGRTRGLLGPARGGHLIDAYCGVGFFSIELASLFETVTGLEFDRRAVGAARRNAASRNAANVAFIEGPVEETWPRTAGRFKPGEVSVLLDPPRAGCSPGFVEVLRQYGPATILYVSCHPATLARDLRAFCAEGRYRVEAVAPLDMFPQTQHLECIALLVLPRGLS